ncbi:MAG: hypothetical protein FWE82_02075 [Defluviitaleaceae bacterium]|nr:hypothetical protein [Defluviitaleaceae bacterium]
MKIVIIGGGSYVFAPTIIEDAIIKSRSEAELVFVDINAEAARDMAGLAVAIARDEGVKAAAWGTDNRRAALAGADFVVASVAYEGTKRWMIDFEICAKLGIPYELRENGALSGLMYGLRNIALVTGICRDMEELCPDAVLLNVSNPLSRVLAAVKRSTGIKAYGFCSVAQCGRNGYERVASLLGKGVDEIDAVSAGINHFAWLTEVKDIKTGSDLLPDLIDALYADQRIEGRNESKIQTDWYERFGAVAAPPSGHVCEFLPLQADVRYLDHSPYHGSKENRDRRFAEIKQISEGSLSYRDVPGLLGSSWEHPALFAAAVHGKNDLSLTAVNLPNDGNLPQLPPDAVVEVPAQIKNGALFPRKGITLPQEVIDVCLNQNEIIEMTAQAAETRSKSLALKIVENDLSITKKAEAKQALELMLEAHKDIIELK